MPMMGSTDTLTAKPKFPVERTNRGLVKLSINAATFTTSTLNAASVLTAGYANLANGMIASGVNVGNTAGVPGFDAVGPYITNIQGTAITMSQAIGVQGGILPAGEIITFSKPLPKKNLTILQAYANTANANTYLVTGTRMANANSILHPNNATIKMSNIAHQGWVHVKVGTGYVKYANTVLGGKGYLPGNPSGYVTLTPNSQYGDTGTGANVAYNVNSNGSIISFTTNAVGNNYIMTPGGTIAANAVGLEYISGVTVTLGGFLYSNGFLVFAGPGSGANVSYTVNAAGSIIYANVVSTGGGWVNAPAVLSTTSAAGNTANATFTVNMTAGSNAKFNITMGGRANRIMTEVLAITANGTASDPNSGGLWFPGT